MQFWLTLKVDFECQNERKLAELELAALIDGVGSFQCAANGEKANRESYPNVLCAEEFLYVLEAPDTYVPLLLSRLSYWHSVILRVSNSDTQHDLTKRLTVRENLEFVEALTISTILERSAYNDFSIDHILNNEGYLDSGFLNSRASTRQRLKGAHDRKRNAYLSHDFHKYKAKFFPRMTRALINITCPKPNDLLLDPFCGSGTANVEASLMGLRSIGLDIDPLSVFIAEQKTSLEAASADGVIETLSQLSKKPPKQERAPSLYDEEYRLPKFLLRQRASHLTGAVAEQIEADVSAALAVASGIKNQVARDLYRLAVSHALATKISLRWMGTGDNRFAVEIAKRSFAATLCSRVDLICRRLLDFRTLRQAGFIASLGPARVGLADVTELPLGTGTVSGIVTSPPYLPASSGRETYLRSRAASLVALGLMSETEVVDREPGLLGSILASPEGVDWLPKEVKDLVDWMLPQRARAPKALPTAAYFEKLGFALAEMARCLKPGGKLAFVVSRHHSFYELVSKKVVAQFDMVKNIAELVNSSNGRIPLNFVEAIDIELGKADFVARPASQHAYYESVMIFERWPEDATKAERLASNPAQSVAAQISPVL